MKITGARWSGGELILSTNDPEARRFVLGFTEGDYTIHRSAQKRSLTANAYAWVLIDKLASALHMGKMEIYRNTIRDIGGVSDVLCMTNEAFPDFKRHWESNGDGWQVSAEPSNKLNGCLVVTAYYGSSVFNVYQMSTFIDHLKQDCESLGIETMPPEKLQALLESWNGK